MNQEQIEAILGRSLSTRESNNFDWYLDIAIERLSSLLCIQWPTDDSGAVNETRVYAPRNGYTILYVDPFTELDTVTIDGEEQEVTKQQWDRRSGTWYNALIFAEAMTDKEVSVTATFGYGELPGDLQLLLAQIFQLISNELVNDARIASKRNEDFTVSYRTGENDVTTAWDSLKKTYSSIIGKYSQCGIGQIQHGNWQKKPYRYGGGKAEE